MTDSLSEAVALVAIAKLKNAQLAKKDKSMIQTLAIASGFFCVTTTSIIFPPAALAFGAIAGLWLYDSQKR